MPHPKLEITDNRMLQLMEYCTANKLCDAGTIKAWCELVGVSHTNIYNIRKGMQQFTASHILQACRVFGVRADFIFGFTDEIFPTDKKRTPIDKIKEAINELELQQNKVKPVTFLNKKKVIK